MISLFYHRVVNRCYALQKKFQEGNISTSDFHELRKLIKQWDKLNFQQKKRQNVRPWRLAFS